MSPTFSSIPKTELQEGSKHAWPHELPEITHLDDSALDSMTDFHHVRPATICPDLSIIEAQTEMRACRVHRLIVVDESEEIIGIISSADILGERLVKVIQEKRIPREKVKVFMLMNKASHIVVFNIEDLKHAKIGDIVQTLHEAQQPHALVAEVDEKTNKQTICGIFTLSHISHQIGVNVTTSLSEAHSVSELQRGL